MNSEVSISFLGSHPIQPTQAEDILSNRTIKGTTMYVKESGHRAENKQIPLTESQRWMESERWMESQGGKGWTRPQNRLTLSFISSRSQFSLSLLSSNDGDSKMLSGSSKPNWF